MEGLEWQRRKVEKEGGVTMTIERALTISLEEYGELRNECNGFNDEVYKNHQVHREGETIGEFIKRGSCRLMANPIIKGKLGD